MAFTFFFRDQNCLQHGIDYLLPAIQGRSRVRVWDAGCAMGHEPYTLAILLAESMGNFGFRNLQIHATDYDPPLLETLKAAIYPLEEVKRIPPEYFEKYFESLNNNGHYRIVDKIRNAVAPGFHDLLSMKPYGENFSLIVCKNVLLHFSPSERVQVIKMFNRALEPGGLLVTENTQKMPKEISHYFEALCSDAQVYRKIREAK